MEMQAKYDNCSDMICFKFHAKCRDRILILKKEESVSEEEFGFRRDMDIYNGCENSEKTIGTLSALHNILCCRNSFEHLIWKEFVK